MNLTIGLNKIVNLDSRFFGFFKFGLKFLVNGEFVCHLIFFFNLDLLEFGTCAEDLSFWI